MARVVKACTMCKLKKLKCDGERPCCSRCQKLGRQHCEYLPDKRTDKRQRMGDKHVFVFKNGMDTQIDPKQHLCRPGGANAEGLLVILDKSFLSSSRARDFQPSIYFPMNFPDVGQPWPGYTPSSFLADMHFNMDQFFFSLDKALPIESQLDTTKTASTPRHKILIDAVFGNKTHISPAITHDLIKKIDNLSSRTDGEEFLHATILTIGALTLARREMAGTRKDLFASLSSEAEIAALDLGPTKMATEAFDHYLRAKALIPLMLEYPSINGFQGLAVMANFMSVLLTPKTQLVITYHALQIAVAIGLTLMPPVDTGSQEHGLVVAFWGLWCSSSLLSTFHGQPPPLARNQILTPANVKMLNIYVEKFSWIRIKFAELAGLVSEAIHGHEENDCYAFLHERLLALSYEVGKFKQIYTADTTIFKTHELLVLGLKCWKAYVAMLLNLPALLEMRSDLAVAEAKTVIKDIWQYYYSYKQNGRPHLPQLPNLDWNFCYPLRHATLCVWIACMILTKSLTMLSSLSFDHVELSLGIELLTDLTSIIPINTYLLQELQAMRLNETRCTSWLFK